MSAAQHDAERHLPLSDLPFQILLALGAGEAHGYAIGKEIEERTAGRLNPTTGSLYQALRRLREDGLIAVAEVAADPNGGGDARRQYFQLTPLGRRVVSLEIERLEALISVAQERSLVQKRS
ncbi:PadR family transcriptional regulator [Gemmatimonadota bacterium]